MINNEWVTVAEQQIQNILKKLEYETKQTVDRINITDIDVTNLDSLSTVVSHVSIIMKPLRIWPSL
jgi:hypothetical protein